MAECDGMGCEGKLFYVMECDALGCDVMVYDGMWFDMNWCYVMWRNVIWYDGMGCGVWTKRQSLRGAEKTKMSKGCEINTRERQKGG